MKYALTHTPCFQQHGPQILTMLLLQSCSKLCAQLLTHTQKLQADFHTSPFSQITEKWGYWCVLWKMGYPGVWSYERKELLGDWKCTDKPCTENIQRRTWKKWRAVNTEQVSLWQQDIISWLKSFLKLGTLKVHFRHYTKSLACFCGLTSVFFF